MTTYTILESGVLRLRNPKDERTLRSAVRTLMDSYLVQVQSAEEAPSEFTLYFSGHVDNGPFSALVQDLASGIGPLLISAVELRVREHSTSEDGDQIFYAGPTPAAIMQLRQQVAMSKAMALLLPVFDPESVETALRALRTRQTGARPTCPLCHETPTRNCQFANCKREWAKAPATEILPSLGRQLAHQT